MTFHVSEGVSSAARVDQHKASTGVDGFRSPRYPLPNPLKCRQLGSGTSVDGRFAPSGRASSHARQPAPLSLAQLLLPVTSTREVLRACASLKPLPVRLYSVSLSRRTSPRC
jgi:hypothetical protein